MIDLHLWNEQIPVKPVAGHSLAWGCRFNRNVAKSLRGLVQFLMSKPQLSDINIIRAITNLDSLQRIAARDSKSFATRLNFHLGNTCIGSAKIFSLVC